MQIHYKLSSKATVSSRGQLVIPKDLRDLLGLHTGTEVVLIVTKEGSLKLTPVKRTIDMFFGRCKDPLQKIIPIEDMDSIIMQTALESDAQTKTSEQ